MRRNILKLVLVGYSWEFLIILRYWDIIGYIFYSINYTQWLIEYILTKHNDKYVKLDHNSIELTFVVRLIQVGIHCQSEGIDFFKFEGSWFVGVGTGELNALFFVEVTMY